MNINDVKKTICGPMIPVITNLNQDLSVDHAGIRNEVQYLIDHGIQKGRGVLLAAGAGGDFNMLNLEERKLVCRTIVEAAENRVPVLVGAQDTNVNNMIEMAKYAEEIHAYGIQFSTTYYYPPSNTDALNLYRTIHDATSSIAIMAYNTFWHNYDFPFEILDQVSELERVVSLKWARPDNGIPYMEGVTRYSDKLAVVDNGGMHVMNHMLGGTGYITHLATVWPEHDLSVWKLLEAGDYSEAQQKIQSINWPWLKFRGHLDNISNNMFLGANFLNHFFMEKL
jgi:4-hydroxy-tetrahydrodipicolinate synthase